MMTHSVNIHLKKSLHFNEIAHLSQFIEYTPFRTPFGIHFEKFRSSFYVGAVLSTLRTNLHGLDIIPEVEVSISQLAVDCRQCAEVVRPGL